MRKNYFLLSRTFVLAAIAIVGASAPAFANDGYGDNNNSTYDDPQTGLYVGGYGGYSWIDPEAASLDVDGAEYGAFVGYEFGTLFKHSLTWGMHAGVEAFYGLSDADDSTAGITVKKDHEWGVSFRPGFDYIDNHSPFGAKPYAIVGYRNANFETSTGGDDNLDGFELGIGTELLAYSDFGVRLDYSHVFYEDKGGIDPDEDSVRLGLAYHF